MILQEVPQAVYEARFEQIFQWMRTNAHENSEAYEYRVVDLDRTYLKVIDISPKGGRLHFRVLLKATYDDLTQPGVPSIPIREVSWIQQAKTAREAVIGVALQECYVHLNDASRPTGGILFSYSVDKWYRVEIG